MDEQSGAVRTAHRAMSELCLTCFASLCALGIVAHPLRSGESRFAGAQNKTTAGQSLARPLPSTTPQQIFRFPETSSFSSIAPSISRPGFLTLPPFTSLAPRFARVAALPRGSLGVASPWSATADSSAKFAVLSAQPPRHRSRCCLFGDFAVCIVGASVSSLPKA